MSICILYFTERHLFLFTGEINKQYISSGITDLKEVEDRQFVREWVNGCELLNRKGIAKTNLILFDCKGVGPVGVTS